MIGLPSPPLAISGILSEHLAQAYRIIEQGISSCVQKGQDYYVTPAKLYLTSPDGTHYYLSVADGGGLSTNDSAPPGGGTVTSVNLTSTTGLTASGGPITSSGSLTYTLAATLQTLAGATVSAFALTLLDDASAAAARTTLGAADDTAVVHLAGSETITGEKRFDNEIGMFTAPDVAEALLLINANSIANPVPAIEVYADNGTTQANISATTYGVNGGGIFHGRMARGTKASPTAVLKDDIYGGYGCRPYASGTGFTVSSPVSLHWVASENQSSTTLGGYLRVLTTPKGSAQREERLIVTDAGGTWSHDDDTYDATDEAQYNFLSGWNGFVSSAVGQNSRLVAVSYDGTGAGTLNLATVRGSPSAPSSLLNTNLMGTLAFTTYASGWVAPAIITAHAAENQSSTALGTYLGFHVTPVGSATRAERLRLHPDGRFSGTALHNNAGAVTGTTDQFIASGTYTPTLTNTTNVAASTSNVAQWMRVGNVVTVSGLVAIDPTAAGLVILGISIPIASDFNADSQLGGMAGSLTESAQIFADQPNNRALLAYTAVAVTNLSFPFTFTYLVR